MNACTNKESTQRHVSVNNLVAIRQSLLHAVFWIILSKTVKIDCPNIIRRTSGNLKTSRHERVIELFLSNFTTNHTITHDNNIHGKYIDRSESILTKH